MTENRWFGSWNQEKLGEKEFVCVYVTTQSLYSQVCFDHLIKSQSDQCEIRGKLHHVYDRPYFDVTDTRIWIVNDQMTVYWADTKTAAMMFQNI